ncbi:recombinase family protein [Microbulbifer elongatus]|uniref:recombinase family protein n=1 Tax=Microbulbifer elongatus TaxID=86173 RepID=UPI001CFD012E|nr:recombinase family protein [Microbulbifer elongatus]
MLVGYCRVSSVGQNLNSQIDQLKAAGVTEDHLFTEKRSGADKARPILAECLRHVRKGDTLVVTRLDRLARSVAHLCEIRDQLEKRGVELKILALNLDTSTAAGKLTFGLLASVAEFELSIRAERQADGIKAAQERGVQFGRKAKLTDEQVEELRQRHAEGEPVAGLAKEYGVSRNTIYTAIRAS